MGKGTDLMSDVYAKLDWAEKHLDNLMAAGNEYLQIGGEDQRPLGILLDNSRHPLIVATFTVDRPMPVAISLHAADCIHNARTALDHLLARLKEHFGGNQRTGTFPITQNDADWKGRIYPKKKGKRVQGPLDGLPAAARLLIYGEQPHVAFAGHRTDDPLVTLSSLDNDDKHRLLRHGFAYPTVERGVDLIEVRDRTRIVAEENLWTAGQPLEDGTKLARYRIRGKGHGLMRADQRAEVKVSTGPLDAPHVTYEAIIERVRGVADHAAALIDQF